MKNKIIISITVAFLIVAAVAGYIALKGKKPVDTTATPESTSADIVSSEADAGGQRTVIFTDDTGSEIGRGNISDEKITGVPTSGYEKEGYVFTGWGEDVDQMISRKAQADTAQADISQADQTDGEPSTPSKSESSDEKTEPEAAEIKAEPQYRKIADRENVFAMPDEYVPSGEKAEVKLMLDGKVDVCAFDLKLTYDPEKLAFVEFTDLGDNVIANQTDTPGVIRINYASAFNADGSFLIGKVVFRQLDKNVAFSDIKTEVIEAVKVDENNRILPASSEAMNCEIWFY